jgi:acyl-CoA synthetase (NDP forming)
MTSSHPDAALERLINPSSIAVIAASPRAGSFGERLLHNLRDFSGKVFAVNPKYDLVGSAVCYPSMDRLPEVPDCAVLVGNRDTVEDAIRSCAEIGTRAAIVFASGFAETGIPERVAQQARLVALSRQTGVRIVGPNSMGIVNCASGARMTFQSVIPPAPRTARAIGLVSQSGALGLGLAQASSRGVPFSHVLTCGNSCDVDIADLVDYLVDNAACASIACTFEGMAAPLKLVRAAQRAWTAGKPLIVYKMATGEQGTAAAASHTGSLAGSHAMYRAALEQAGAIVVDDFNALIETAAFFAKAPDPRGTGIAVLATSGGAAIVAADEAENHGVPLPQPGTAAREVLTQHVPEFGSVANPCDVTAQVLNNPAALVACADALMADDGYAALVVPHTLSYEFGLARIATFNEAAARHGKIACNVWMSEWLGGPGTAETETCDSVALFRSMQGCFSALAAWRARAQRRHEEALAPVPGAALRVSSTVSAAAPLGGAGALTEREAKAMLSNYGIPITREAFAGTAAEAVMAARDIGFPVVVKIESVDLLHKTEAGGVALDLRTVVAVEEACARMLESARRISPNANIAGFLVQEMVPRGLEIVIGGTVDPMFGPVIVVGFGGVFVELLKDTAMALAPVDAPQALRLLRKLRHGRLFEGYRGSPAVDVQALAQIVVQASNFLADQADALLEFDINPLIGAGGRFVAVDALIVTKSSSSLADGSRNIEARKEAA